MTDTFALATCKDTIKKTGKKCFTETSHLQYALFLMAQEYQYQCHLKF
jgi:hypothetical protein